MYKSTLTFILALSFFWILPAFTQAAMTINVPTSNGLVGYWSFNDATGTIAHDFSGNGNNGTLTSSPTWVNGKLNQALSFNRSNSQYVNIPNLTVGSTGSSTAMTFTAWVYSTVTQTTSAGILESRSGTPSSALAGLFLSTNSNNMLTTCWYNHSTCWGANTGLVIPNNQWTFVAGVATTTGDITYMNNSSFYIADASSEQKWVTSTWNIGRDVGASHYWNGKIDDVHLYNRALTAAEISTIYNAGAVKYNAPSSPGTLASGLVGYWTMDGNSISSTTMYDQSGNNNTGTLVNSPTPVAGKLGQALSFATSSAQYVSVPNTTNLNTNLFTVSAWIKPSVTLTSKTAGLGCKWVQGSGPGWYLELGESSNSFRFGDAGLSGTNGLDWVGAYPVLNANTWYFVTFSYDGANKNAYYNGVFQESTAATGTIATTTQPLKIGISTGTGGNSNYFPGTIDDFRLYNRALSAGEIKQLYNIGAGAHVNAAATPLGTLISGLIGLWTFNGTDLSSATATDLSGQGNNGTLVGGPTPVAGKLGQALSFASSSSQYVKLKNKINVVVETVSFWLKTTQSTLNTFLIENDANLGWSVGLGTGGTISFYNPNGSGTISATSSPAVNNGNWHLVTITNDTATTTMYIDAVARNITAQPGVKINNLAAPWFGAREDLSGFYNGSLDDVRVYNRALSAAEVKQLYNMGK